jgi:hypothetical protein
MKEIPVKSFFEAVTGTGEVPPDYKPAGKLSLDAAFAVYQRGYVARLTEILGDTFEAVWKVLGDELFFAVAAEFIRGAPSQSYNLSDYSEKFIPFLRNHPVSEEFPFLADLANLGWQKKELFNAPTEVGLSGEALPALLEEEARPARFVTSFRLVSSEFCLYDLWESLEGNTEPPTDWDRPQALALYKANSQVFLKAFDLKTFRALENIQYGAKLFDACEELDEAELTALFQFFALSSVLA